MSSELSDKLLGAENLDAFLNEQAEQPRWRVLSALKSEVDRLVGCDLKSAARLAGRIEELAKHLGDSAATGFAEVSRARVLHLSGKYAEAAALYESAAASLRLAGLPAEAAGVRIHQVDALMLMGRYSEALRIARSARQLLARESPVKLAQLENNVGNVYYMLDRYRAALKHYDRAHEIFRTAGDEAMLAFVDYSRSNILAEMDRPHEAQALLERAAAAWDKAGRTLLAAQALYNLSYLQFLRGKYNAALTGYYQARSRVAELGNTRLVAWCDLEIAEVLLALNAFDDAAESAASARENFNELGLPYESAKATLARALAAMGLEQFERAWRDLTEAREVFQANANTTFAAQTDAYLAELALKRGDAAEAAARSASALRVFARQKLPVKSAYARLLAARAAYQMGDRRKATRQARAALGTIEDIYAPAVAYHCHHLLGCIERDNGQPQAALDSFRRAVETIERMRGGVAADEWKATFLRDKIVIYEDAIAACLNDGSPSLIEEAFALVEASKSRALADLLAHFVRGGPPDDIQGRSAGIQDEARARLAKLMEELNWYNSHANLEDEKGNQRSTGTADRYRRAVLRRERQIAQLFRRLEMEGRIAAHSNQAQTATLSDLRHALADGEVAIEYFTTGDEVAAFIVSPGGVKVARVIASKRDLERRLAALRFQIEKFTFGSDYVDALFWQLKGAIDQCLTELYEAIFAPLEGMLDGDQLIVIPHGALHYLPFHALCDRRGYYLIDRFEVSYAPSAAVLGLCRAKQGDGREGILVAFGVAERGTPEIEQEVGALNAIFPETVVCTGSEATRDNLMRLAPRARFLHLASHGYFRRDNPMFSFLKLADARLNFYNLLDLKLNAEMVTLSACHTGVNRVFPGDELHGLMRGFLYAGAPALVVSLWGVNDRSTAELMRELYSQIRAGREKRSALRAAQLAIKDAYGHPYYWAPFVLMGNPS
ncbi:MAG TPA: CHAT domain-containing tetratricopeptide repeat protein [Blastocatellia bacterium]|nr:CHAT domain-containing tetratricopeptide repeat protein [Blastocatellia bacterium]